MQFALIAIAAFFLMLVTAGFYFARIALYPKTRSYENVYQSKLEAGEFSPTLWESWVKEEIWIDSPYGYRLHGYWLPVPDALGTVVLVHGITVNIFASLKYVMPFRKRRFNVLIYDHRNHGKSGGTVTTFGFYEKFDLKAVLDWVEEKVGMGTLVGTHGESMGAATVLQHAAIDPRPAFVIEDCGYSNLMKLFHYRVRQDYHLPGWVLLPIASIWAKLLTGCSFLQIRPINDVQNIKSPVFFIHGEKDDYITPTHAREMYEVKQTGFRKLWIVPDAGHAESAPSHPDEYDHQIGEFLDEIIS
ncbi:MAG: alpha/beta hydrolase [Anaerolineae bacterium]|nr:alpha/beta hydrolase [Anaerolineae bacterium]